MKELKSIKIPAESHAELKRFCEVTRMPMGRALQISVSRFVSSEEAQRIVSAHRAAQVS